MALLDTRLIQPLSDDAASLAGFEHRVRREIRRLSADRRLRHALAPWETAMVVMALAFGMVLGTALQTNQLTNPREANPFSVRMTSAASTLLLSRSP